MMKKIRVAFNKANNALAGTSIAAPLLNIKMADNNMYPKKIKYPMGKRIFLRILNKKAHGKISELNNCLNKVTLGK
jgi:hypothetical protein